MDVENNNVEDKSIADESTFKCKSCANYIKRVFLGEYYPNGKDKKWIDEATGKQCNGLLCSTCQKARSTKYSKLRHRRKKREARMAKRIEEQHEQNDQ